MGKGKVYPIERYAGKLGAIQEGFIPAGRRRQAGKACGGVPEFGTAEQKGKPRDADWQSRRRSLHFYEGNSMHVYCLFCQTQRTGRIAELLESWKMGRAFSPRVICRHRVQGQLVDKTYDLLPGYVFLFANELMTDFSAVWEIDGAGYHVGRREDQYELVGDDRIFALELYETDGIIRPMTMVREGEKVKLQNSLFENGHGKITEIEYKKQRARVEFSFADKRWAVWVAVNEQRL